MAQLAFGLVGAFIGDAAIAGTIFGFTGAQIGFNIGSLIGGFLFAPEQPDTFGPRLTDLKVTSSTPGLTIPIGFGTYRMNGNIIFANKIEEVATSVGGKGPVTGLLGGGASHTSFTYFGTFAVGFAYREAASVVRIWANGRVILDRRPGKSKRMPGLKFKFYPGSQSQLADKQMKKKKGAANTPAHRGLVYIMFNRLPLADFGNGIPNINAEIAFKAAPANTVTSSVPLASSTTTSYASQTLFADAKRNRIYTSANRSDIGGINTYLLGSQTFSEVREAPSPGHHGGTGGILMRDSQLFVHSSGSGNTREIDFIHAETNIREFRFGEQGSSPSNWDLTHAARIEHACELTAIDPLGRGKFHWYMAADQNDRIGIIIINDNGPNRNPPNTSTAFTVLFFNNDTGPSIFGNIMGMLSYIPQVGFGEAWVCADGVGAADIKLTRVRIDANASRDPVTGIVTGLTIDKFTITAADGWKGDTKSGDMVGPLHDTVDNTLIFWHERTITGSYVFKWDPATETVQWVTETGTRPPIGDPESSILTSDVSEGRLAWIDLSDTVTLIDTRDGELIIDNLDTSTMPGGPVPDAGGQFWDGPSQSIICGQGDTNVGRVFLDLLTGEGELLSTVGTELTDLSGYEASQVDVDDLLNDTVRGYAVTRQMSARSAFGPLATTFAFDATEADAQIRFVKLGTDPVRTINADDLVIKSNGEVIPERRVEEVELPETISIVYADFDRSYQEGSVSVKRIREPTPLVFTRVGKTIELPIALTAVEAKRAIERLLHSTWRERITYNWEGPMELLELVPTDVVTLVQRSGATFEVRINKEAIGVNLIIAFEGVGTEKALFTAVSLSDGGLDFEEDIPLFAKATQLFIFDIPLIRDVDATAGVATRSYFTMSGFELGWPGGTLFRSLDDGGLYIPIEVLGTPGGTIGLVLNKLPRTDVPFQIDESLQLEIILPSGGTLTSVTNSEFLDADTNAALIGSIGSNNWEIIFFQNATQQAEPERYILDRIIRGRRGTDIHVNSHRDGETFILLERAIIGAFLNNLSEIDQTNFYRGVGDLQILEEADITIFKGTGADLKPYAAVNLVATLDGSSNIDMVWQPRTRIGGEIGGSVIDKPIGETSEEYEVDVLNKPGYLGGVVIANGAFTALITPAAELLNSFVTSELGLRATEILTLTAQPSDGEQVTLDTTTYTFRTSIDNDVANEVLIGTDAEDTLENLLAAMDLSQFSSDKIVRTHYSNLTTLLTSVIGTRLSGTLIRVQAAIGGTGGNSIVTTETLTNGSFGAGTMSGGAATVPLEVDFVVYQISAVVQRGFPREARTVFV